MSSPSQGPPTAISFPPERAKAAARPHLVVLSGSEMGRAIELSNEPLEIGRDPECGIVLMGEGISRKHARVQLIFALYFVTDLGSTNGTFVNEQPATMAQLKDGDQIRLGDAVLKFVEHPLEVQYSQRVLDLATTDPLTGTATKRSFDAQFERSLQQARQSGAALSLVLVDIDHFKRLNDELGHAVGDQALASMARAVAGVLPPGASLYRVGGEEFAVLMPGLVRGDALARAELIRDAVASQPLRHSGELVPLTVSLGVAQLGDGEASAEVYARADQLLYKSKRGGRNRVS